MAIATVTQWEVRPGKMPQFRELLGQAKKLHEGMGVKVRIWNTAIGGTSTGRVTYAVEYPDLAAFSDFATKLAGSKQWQELGAKVAVAEVGERLGMVLMNEVDV